MAQLHTNFSNKTDKEMNTLLTRREVNQLYPVVTEAHDLFEVLPTPQGNALLVERCKVRALRRPTSIRLRPAL